MKTEGTEIVKPRVIIIENSRDFTGGLNSILSSNEFLKEEFDFYFVLPSGSKSLSFVTRKGFVVFQWPMKEIRKNIFSVVVYLPFLVYNTFRLLKLVKKLNADLIISNDFYNLIPPLYRILRGRIKYICYVRFLPSKFPKHLVKLWHWLHNRYASAIIAVSNAVRSEFSNKGKIVVIGNVLPEKDFDLSIPVNNLILYPSNYIQGKGHVQALECFARIHMNNPLWILRFIGSDMGLEKNMKYKERLVTKAKLLGISDCVQWSGFSNKMDCEYLNAGIVLNFSESESFSLTCLEAMFYGRPLIATKSGGPQEMIESGISGLLVDVNDIDAMSQALEYLISNPSKRIEFGHNAYWMVRKNFKSEVVKDQINSLYVTAIRQKSI